MKTLVFFMLMQWGTVEIVLPDSGIHMGIYTPVARHYQLKKREVVPRYLVKELIQANVEYARTGKLNRPKKRI